MLKTYGWKVSLEEDPLGQSDLDLHVSTAQSGMTDSLVRGGALHSGPGQLCEHALMTIDICITNSRYAHHLSTGRIYF